MNETPMNALAPETLDLHTFPLEGLALIEASAGTGKTYALSNLVLRYILEKNYQIEQILIVTFTEAATQELRVRVRANIVQYIKYLERLIEFYDELEVDIESASEAGSESISGIDKVQLESLIPDALARNIISRLDNLNQSLLALKIAEQSIDLAEIHTIHGFCQKVGRDNAVLLNVPSNQELKEDLKPMRLEVCQDVWRSEILELKPSVLRYVISNWGNPAMLMSALSVFSSRIPERIYPTVSFNDEGLSPIRQWQVDYAQIEQWVEDLKTLVLAHIDDVTKLVGESDLTRLNYKLAWLNKIRSWAEDNASGLPDNSLKFDKFFESHLPNETKKGKQPPEHAFFVFLEKHFINEPADPKPIFVQAVFTQVNKLFEARKCSEQILDFDDLILQLKHATDNEHLAKKLTVSLRKQYRVALIDEFQDTDANQYPIFSRLFGTECTNSDSDIAPSLVLIGDPKQAIYGFRGGDMATYLRAKHDVENAELGSVFTMDKNWRSSTEMVASLNALFGAHSNPFLEKEIPYIHVDAAKGSSECTLGSALRYSEVEAFDEDGKPLSKAEIADSLSLLLASQVCEVLNNKTLGLQSSDLAILVRTKNEARQVKQVLAQVGVKSCFDDDASVFESAEAMSLAFLLDAVQNPTNIRAMRSVLQDPFWQVTDAELSHVTEDEFALQTWVERFQNLQHHWQRYGVLSMVRSAIDDFSILKHWHKAATSHDSITLDWERSLTNISQLAELLQEKARTLRSENALLRWYGQCIQQTAQPSAEKLATHQLRLESDEALVRIVTIHKSKGLEYPIVFLPFLFTTREAQQAWYYDEAGRLCLALEPNDQQQAAADRERLAEEMRLLYVALTRAQYRCYIGTAEFSGSRSPKMYSTALGYLLANGQLPDDLEKGWLQDAISRFTGQTDASTSYQYLTFEEVHAINRSSRLLIDQSAQSASELSGELFAPHLKQSWKVQSFTGLLNEHRALNPHSEHTHRSSDDLGEAPPANAIDIMNFPKGSQAGTFLHRLFEDIEFATGELNSNVAATNLEEHIRNLLQQYALVPERHEQAWAAYLVTWVQQVLALPLIDIGSSSEASIALAQLDENDYRVEAEFYFSVDDFSLSTFNSLLRQYNPNAEALSFEAFEGHIKGAIDLLFRTQGAYFVLDYKSNHLGFSADNYTHDKLEAAINEHRYDVQYLLYSLAIHRLLKARMGDTYSYEAHFGGVVYLFLRGLGLAADGDNPAGVYFIKPEQSLIEGLDQIFTDGGAQ